MTNVSPDSKFVSRFIASPNVDERGGSPVDVVVLHYTGMPEAEATLARLCDADAKVSSHYLVREDGAIVQLVAEDKRAWHAGVSRWREWTGLNARSIGIEIVNPGHDGGCPAFPDVQIDAVIALTRDIAVRRSIPRDLVLAHSDIAPLRKQDPGEWFPWDRLAAEGVGLWVAPAPLSGDSVEASPREQAAFIESLAAYGYGVALSDSCEMKQAVVAAFQRHFRPTRVDGKVDRSSIDTLLRLLSARQAMAAES